MLLDWLCELLAATTACTGDVAARDAWYFSALCSWACGDIHLSGFKARGMVDRIGMGVTTHGGYGLVVLFEYRVSSSG